MLAPVNRKERVRREMVGLEVTKTRMIKGFRLRLPLFYALLFFLLCILEVDGSVQAAEWVEHRAFGPFVRKLLLVL